MRIGRYSVGLNTLFAVRRMLRDRVRVARRGIPRLPHEGGADLAALVLRANARNVFRAGAGHFHVMWPTDFGKAFGGARLALSPEYLGALLRRMTRTGAQLGYVPTCFTDRGHYDLPWRRADNVPWLLHMVEALGDRELVKELAPDLEKVYADWVREHVDKSTGLLHRHVWGDWMDTVPRPSSTYNNLCAIRGYRAADALGLESAPTFARDAEQALLDSRWTGTHLMDHAGDDSHYLSTDANVPALYLGILPESHRHKIVDAIEASGLCDPFPMRTRVGAFGRHELPPITRLAPSYHHTTWLHLGLMYMNGLKRLGRPYAHHLAAVDDTVRRYGNFLETLDARGRAWSGGFMTTEYGFSMSAGQYLELVGAPAIVPPPAVPAPASVASSPGASHERSSPT